MPLDAPPVADGAVQVGGYAGVAHGFGEAPVEQVVGGVRVARGAWGGVLDARVGLAPDAIDPLAATVAELGAWTGSASPFPSLVDRFGVAAAAELGTPTFGPRFSGGPYAQLGVDLSSVRRTFLAVDGDALVVHQTADILVPGARLAVGATWTLGAAAALRVELADTVRATSILNPPFDPAQTAVTRIDPAPYSDADPPFVHHVRLAATVVVGR